MEGQYVSYSLLSFIKANLDKTDGIIDIYSGMNPLKIDSITRGIPAFDLDMNRIFPGRDDGDMNKYIAKCIIDNITGSDLVMDIHASNIYLREVPQIRINEVSKERLIPLAKKANVDFIWVSPNETVLESTLAFPLNTRNTDTLVVEMGVGMRITKDYGNQLFSGIIEDKDYDFKICIFGSGFKILIHFFPEPLARELYTNLFYICIVLCHLSLQQQKNCPKRNVLLLIVSILTLPKSIINNRLILCFIMRL